MQRIFIKKVSCFYGGKCLSRKAVHNWIEKFSQGRSKVAADARPGRPVEIATEATAQRVEELMRADQRITDSVAQAVSRRLHTTAARVRAQVTSCEICSGKSSTGAAFLRVLWFPLPILIPPTAPQ
jgi:transposase